MCTLVFSPINLIEEVKARPELYTSTDRIGRADRLRLWKEVGAALFHDWEKCNKATVYGRVLQIQKKWKCLKDAYNRELRIRRSQNARSRSVYRYFKRMSFLGGFDGSISSDDSDSHETQLQYTRKLDDDDYTGPDPVKQESLDQTNASETEYSAPAVIKRKKVKRKKRKRQQSTSTVDDTPHAEDSLSMEMSTFPMEFSGETETDSDKLFLLSFLPEMRQLPSHIKMWTRAQIANVMQEAVSSHYNNTRPGISTENLNVR